jgi:hypothetical protein
MAARASVAVLVLFVEACSGPQISPRAAAGEIVVPRLWDDDALATWATPVAGLGVPPTYPSAAEYYAAPVDSLRTYPVYHPAREPLGYREWIRSQGPRPIIEPATLRTEADWIRAGQEVFEALDDADSRTDDPRVIEHFTNAGAVDRYRDAAHDVVTKEGILLDYRWVVDNDGALKLSFSDCSGCHTRLLGDGTVLLAAPCNFDISSAPAVDLMLEQLRRVEPSSASASFYREFGVPWLADDPHARFRAMSDAELKAFRAQDTGEPPGTLFARFNGSPLYPTRMADLRGVGHRRYLDATGTHENRGPADVARYGILVEFAESGVFGPYHMRTPQGERVRRRPSDAAMYAMALYLYSLEPAPSPHPTDERARHGREIFAREGCDGCHSGPYYTSNELVAVDGFAPPLGDAATARLDILPRRVGTDPGLALRTRKGTGYYKIPSLRGLWYRGLFEHDGSIATLEDWFDPRRLRADYVPSGWRGYGVTTRAIPGHPFGLELSAADKEALIAFLLTL